MCNSDEVIIKKMQLLTLLFYLINFSKHPFTKRMKNLCIRCLNRSIKHFRGTKTKNKKQKEENCKNSLKENAAFFQNYYC